MFSVVKSLLVGMNEDTGNVYTGKKSEKFEQVPTYFYQNRCQIKY